MSPRINAPTVQQFTAQADAAQGLTNRVIFRNGRLEGATGLSAFFAGSQARRGAVEAFRRSLVREYGETVADALSPRLDSLCTRGRSLKAAVVRDLLHDAAAVKEDLREVNAGTVQAFRTGAIPEYGLESALDAFCAAHPAIPPERRDDLRELVDTHLQTFAAGDSQNLLTPFRLFESVSRGGLPGMLAMQVACGETPPADYPYKDMMPHMGAWAKDAAWLSLYAEGGVQSFLFNLMIGRLPEMRRLQPEGMISLETVWRACFGEPAPANVLAKWPGRVGNELMTRAEAFIRTALGPAGAHPHTEMQARMAIWMGIRMERAVDLCLHPGPVTQDDLIGPATLCTLRGDMTLAEAEASVAKDIHRWGTSGAIEGYEPVMTFTFPGEGGEVRHHHIQDLTGLDAAQEQAFHSGGPSPKSAALMASVRELCGEGHADQQKAVAFGLSQAGLFFLRNLSGLTGIQRDEHSPCDVSVSRDAAGSVTLRYRTPPESPLDFRAEYVVRPDGSNELTGLELRPRAAAEHE